MVQNDEFMFNILNNSIAWSSSGRYACVQPMELMFSILNGTFVLFNPTAANLT
jgi:hypothetical protein